MRLAAAAREDSSALNEASARAFRSAARVRRSNGRAVGVALDRKRTLAHPAAIRARLFRLALAALGAPVATLTRAHYDAAHRTLAAGAGGADLPGGWRVSGSIRAIRFSR